MSNSLNTIGRFTLFGLSTGAGIGAIGASGALVGKGLHLLTNYMIGDASIPNVDSSKFELAVMTLGTFLLFTATGGSAGFFLGSMKAINDAATQQSLVEESLAPDNPINLAS
jgi:hypothetical protein